MSIPAFTEAGTDVDVRSTAYLGVWGQDMSTHILAAPVIFMTTLVGLTLMLSGSWSLVSGPMTSLSMTHC